MRIAITICATALSLAASACSQREARLPPQQAFFADLSALCGHSYQGQLVAGGETDAAFASQRLVMHVRECSDAEIRIPFHVGEDRSRTWVITRTDQGLRLKHDHRHEDGSEDTLTQYGGDTIDEGLAVRQEFPADQHSKDLFVAQNIPQSANNVWALELQPQSYFAYELRREGRHFRVEFDLSAPVEAPPPPWGADAAAN